MVSFYSKEANPWVSLGYPRLLCSTNKGSLVYVRTHIPVDIVRLKGLRKKSHPKSSDWKNVTYIAMRTSKLPQVLISQPCHQSEESCSNLVFYWFKIKSSYEGSIFCPVVIDTLSSSWIIMANKGLEQVFIWRAGRHDPCLIGGWKVLGKTA